MIETTVYSTKPYDREYLSRGGDAERISWRFHEFALSAETASTAQGAQAVCLFVNDQADRACLAVLAALGVKLIALRCAGYNNLDLTAARELGLAVVRVPAYSPHAVAEHTVGLLLTLNRKIHRAYNRVRELNFSLSGLVGFDLHGKTAGIVGTGKIGRVTAEIFRGFGTNVMVLSSSTPVGASSSTPARSLQRSNRARSAASHWMCTRKRKEFSSRISPDRFCKTMSFHVC